MRIGLGVMLLVTARLVWAAEAPMRLVSAPAVSPDGSRVVFEWCGDLWVAPCGTGEAVRLVDDPARDAYPRFSPDGARIVFSSDRSGSMQVYSMPVSGGETRRHTWHSEGNELECLSPDGMRAVVRGMRERAGFRATRLMEVDLARDGRERRLFDATAHSPAWSPDGRTLLFCRGGEQLYRKGFRGSRASRIWSYTPADGRFVCEVPGDFEARSPMWLPDGGGFYHVSNETGTANLWLRKRGGPPKQLTFYQDDGMIAPALSADGSTLVFRRGGSVFRMDPRNGGEAVEIRLHTREAVADTEGARELKGFDAADISPDGSQVVGSAGGELWWIPKAGVAAVRLTHSPEAEESPRFSPCGGWLYFLSDDGIDANWRRGRIKDGALADVEEVTRGKGSKKRLIISPDGRRIAWISGPGEVFTAAADGADERRVFPGWDSPAIEWSPDGEWLAVAAIDRNANRDILLARADGSREPVNLTRHPAYEGSPKWSPDGRWLVFSARRDAGGAMGLWRIDFGPGGLAKDAGDARLAGLGDRARRVETRGIEPVHVEWSLDSKSLMFQSRRKSNKKLYVVAPDGSGFRTMDERRGLPVRALAGGGLCRMVDSVPEVPADGGGAVFPIDTRIEQSRADRLRLAFRRVWRTLGEEFHDATMNGRDWQVMRTRHEPDAVAARDARQFDLAVSRLFGELNASHLSFLPQRWPGENGPSRVEKKTAHPGIVFDDREADPLAPLKVARVIAGSPVSEIEAPPLPGEVVARIGGKAVSNGSPLHEYLEGAEGRVVPMVIRDAKGRERAIEVRGISHERARQLDLKEREDRSRRMVEERSPGTAYLAVRAMNRQAMETLRVEVHRAAEGHGRLILDLRNNGGGREADRMLAIFTQVRHSVTRHRGGPEGYPLERLYVPAWHGPLVVLCNENTYSNSEIFCHAIQQTGRAPLVGTATAGGVISAVKRRIPGAGELQVPFRSWFDAETRENLDLNGARPDHLVDLGPADEHAGEDPQLAKAIEVIGGSR